jgi:AcrR family transcriptional regulator
MMEEKALSLEMEGKILNSATSVFIKKGKAGASMQDIAVEAGINRTLLNYYFRSKDKLFEQVFSQVFLSFVPVIIEKINSKKPIIKRMEDVMDYYFLVLIDNPLIPVFILQELASNPARLVRIMREKGINPEIFISILSNEMVKGHLRKMDPRAVIINLLSLVIFPFAARPVIEGLIFNGDKKEYLRFLHKRKTNLKKSFIDSIKP